MISEVLKYDTGMQLSDWVMTYKIKKEIPPELLVYEH